MKKQLFITILLAFFISFTQAVVAQSPASDSATPLRDSVKQKVAEELAQIKKAVSKKAFLGTITTKADASLILNTYRNQTRSLIVGTDTAIKLKNGRDGTLADLKTGDFILVLGEVDSAGTMTAKRILVVSQPEAEKRTVVYGTITKTTSSSITVDTVKNESLTIKVTSATKYTGKTKLSALQTGDKIVTVTLNNTALVLHVILAAPSATPKVSPTP